MRRHPASIVASDSILTLAGDILAPLNATPTPHTDRISFYIVVGDSTPKHVGKTVVAFGPYARTPDAEKLYSVPLRSALPGFSVELAPAAGKNFQKFIDNAAILAALATASTPTVTPTPNVTPTTTTKRGKRNAE